MVQIYWTSERLTTTFILLVMAVGESKFIWWCVLRLDANGYRCDKEYCPELSWINYGYFLLSLSLLVLWKLDCWVIFLSMDLNCQNCVRLYVNPILIYNICTLSSDRSRSNHRQVQIIQIRLKIIAHGDVYNLLHVQFMSLLTTLDKC